MNHRGWFIVAAPRMGAHANGRCLLANSSEGRFNLFELPPFPPPPNTTTTNNNIIQGEDLIYHRIACDYRGTSNIGTELVQRGPLEMN